MYFVCRSTIDSNRSDEDIDPQRRSAINAIESALERYMKPIETEQKETTKQVTAMRFELRKQFESLNDRNSWFQSRDIVLVFLIVIFSALIQKVFGKIS